MYDPLGINAPSTAKYDPLGLGETEPGESYLKKAAGVGEAVLSTVIGGVSWIPSGLVKAAGLVSGQLKEGTELGDTVQNALTYEPRTETGKKLAGYVAKPFEMLSEGAQGSGDWVYDKTGSPLLGAAAKTAIESIPFVVPGVAGKGIKKFKSRKEAKVAEAATTTGKVDYDPLNLSEEVKAADPVYDPVGILESQKEAPVDPMVKVGELITEEKPTSPTPQGEIVEPGAASQAVEQTQAGSGIASAREPATAKIPESAPEGSTGIKNAVVDAEREARGLDPVQKQEVYGNEAAFEKAKQAVDNGEIDPRRLAQEVAETPRPITTDESFALNYDRQRIRQGLKDIYSQIEEAQTKRDGAAELELIGKREKLEADLDINDKGATQGGTELGRSLQSRTRMVQEDYSLAEVLQRARADNGGKPLSPAQRQKYEALAKQIEEANTKIAEYENRISSMEAEKTVKQLQNKVAKENRQVKRTYVKQELKAEFDGLVKELNQVLGGHQLNAGIDPKGAVILGKMAANRIKAGLKTAEGLVDSIYTELKNVGIELSKRDIRDAISNYGKTSEMNKETLHVELREARRQMRLISALEDAQAKQSPLRSGLQRDLPSDRVRELQRQVKQAMRENGIDVSKLRSPEQHYKTALDAVKTRLKNQITDIEKQLKTGEKTPKKVGIKYDKEANELKKVRDDLKGQLEAIEGKPAMSPEQRLKMATEAVKKSIIELERRIREHDLTSRPKESKTPVTAELKKLRDTRDTLKKTFQQMQKDAKPPKNPDEIALKSYKTRTTNRIAELEKKMEAGDFSTKPRRELAKDREALTLEFNLDKAKRNYNAARLKDQLARRTILQKAGGAVLETVQTSRAIMTSFDLSAVLRQGGFIVMGHPIQGLKTLPAMFKALRSGKGQFAIEQQIRNNPLYKKAQDAGLFLSEHGDVGLRQMEEAYMSRYAEKIWGVGASQRAYTTFLNKLRMDSFSNMANKLSRGAKATPEEMKAIANFVNVATGRGNLWAAETALVGLNVPFFAPRLVASRFNLLFGQPLYRGSARTRRMVAKEYARYLIGIGTIYTLAKMMGAEVEIDPRSSDFGKIRIGNTRIDPLSGLAQCTTLIARAKTGETKTLGGDVKQLAGEDAAYGASIPGVIGRFLRTKLSPTWGTALDLRQGENVVGEEVTPPSAAVKMAVPMSFRDIYETMKEQGVPGGAALSILGVFGAGLETFEPQE